MKTSLAAHKHNKNARMKLIFHSNFLRSSYYRLLHRVNSICSIRDRHQFTKMRNSLRSLGPPLGKMEKRRGENIEFFSSFLNAFLEKRINALNDRCGFN